MTVLDDFALTEQIAERAIRVMIEYDAMPFRSARVGTLAIACEVYTVHSRIVPLRLREMAEGSDTDLLHDVCGIHRHLSFASSKHPAHLRDCFMPRFTDTDRLRKGAA